MLTCMQVLDHRCIHADLHQSVGSCPCLTGFISCCVLSGGAQGAWRARAPVIEQVCILLHFHASIRRLTLVKSPAIHPLPHPHKRTCHLSILHTPTSSLQFDDRYNFLLSAAFELDKKKSDAKEQARWPHAFVHCNFARSIGALAHPHAHEVGMLLIG